MRIVFVNLHANEMLLKTMSKYVFKQSCAIKHKYLLDYLIKHPEYEVCTYINDRGFSLMHNGNDLLLKWLQIFKYMEHKFVLNKNGIDAKKISIIKDVKDIKKDDIIILYRHHGEQLRHMNENNSFKVVSMIHFWGSRDEAKMIKQAEIDCMMNESNLETNSEIFRRYYDYKGPWIVQPFVFEKRFQNKIEFSKRNNRAFAVGTITYKEAPDFIEVYGDSCDQPSRKQIKDNPEYLEGCVDCYSSDYNEDSTTKKYNNSGNGLVEFCKKLYNRFHTGQQKKYYSFNMVDKFNEYKMCIVGEEILGVPGIGFVEGMACGCAYIGLKSQMYSDYGMQAGVHYIGYDGSLEDLKRVIQYYQMDEHQEELERIAKTGCEYVRTHFNGDAVAKKLMRDLIREQEKWLESK